MTPTPKDALGSKPDLRVPEPPQKLSAQIETDVVIVGAGAGGLSAANAVTGAGAEVFVVEAGDTVGGTTVKSSGGSLVFNNRFHRAAGIEEDRQMTLKLMAKISFPEVYDPEAENFGLEARDFEMIETYFDSSSPVYEALENEGTLVLAPQQSLIGDARGFPTYFSDYPEEQISHGRTLNPQTPDGMEGYGRELIRQLLAGAERKGATVVTGHRVTEILRDGDEVIGVETEGPDGTRRFLARKGVIFATGGFTRNRELMDRYMPGYVPGGGAQVNAQGDLISFTEDMDVELANMENAWLGEVPVEVVLAEPELPTLLFCPYGDSMVYVDLHGKRVVNEKSVYDRRGRIHFATDENGDQPNKLLFMIYDRAVAWEPNNLFAARWPVPPAGETAPYIAEAETLEELEAEFRRRLDGIAEAVGGFQLADDFASGLQEAIARFNKFASNGVDEDFGRGQMPIDLDIGGPGRPGNHPNQTMYPLSPTGPYYGIIVAAATLDTKGGPRTDTVGRILQSDGSPIPGLYGTGNCVASPTGGGYWSGGATLGPAVTFGYLAGRTAAQVAAREVSAESVTA
jgi:3-oxosteroid 1-dehydrogenase